MYRIPEILGTVETASCLNSWVIFSAHTEHRVTFYRMGQGAWRRNVQAQVPKPAL